MYDLMDLGALVLALIIGVIMIWPSFAESLVEAELEDLEDAADARFSRGQAGKSDKRDDVQMSFAFGR